MYLVKAPFFLKWYYPDNILWNKSRDEKKLYLTFDDGPIPEITPFILDTLKAFDVRGTFFCVGENIVKNPEIYARILAEGHRVGNHTYNHLKGWDTPDQEYLENISKCQQLTGTDLFRPPYGRPKRSQLKHLKHFQVVMWDILSGDFDLRLTPENCFKNVLKYTKNGSIIVFHDNIKAIPRVTYALPKTLEHFTASGYTFHTL
ncbi:polysaccharide deacetylase family protein [Sphingobacterium spiritivorum]|uniref:Polysaccharide deacetylase n=1 Tax=Sphingobacterium spiritivorum ATCC 33861 TaxID=525373 RepID=D7VR98_SPHSI|nr:polysaccharide deacetylase family protein [Sphingobacterium spiritivorum]EFK56299.1 polysaccharide deacetylase [Sphingobacterium spiritivorum ATCC 33861]QQT35613.1 polysaccharide deacetylase family protein [Sphingobacterium spiritivorum]WQD32313.1 polysaccharide deacetylase family protein [Sphingobacterium spiritivorum]SUJ07815.1 Probable polysaccharide deacetylase pdaA precursor [Sphingobacterium spiritivorum]